MTGMRIVLALAALLAVGVSRAAEPSRSRSAAIALTGAPATGRDGGHVDAAGARTQAGQAGVSLPDGGNFNGIRWEQGPQRIAQSELEGTLEYNAACQWLRAWRDGREGALPGAVLQAVPDWPLLRGTESGAFVARVAADVAAGGGETATDMLRDCDASHVRESEYAISRGLLPSR